jgi:hypothetical protein
LTPGFHCLEIAALDIASGAEVGVAVTNRDFSKLMLWLEGKKQYESEVLTRGLEQIAVAAKLNEHHYSPLFISSLETAVRLLGQVKQLRSSCSDESQIRNEFDSYLSKIDVVIHELRRIQNGI